MSSLSSAAPAPASPAVDEHDALPAGTRFGELEILRVVGVGGFGIVYLARDHSLDRDVALKEYMPGQLAARGPSAQVSLRSGSHMETFALGLRSFVNEARLLARFDHRSLVKVYRFWEANNTAYMVMPFLQGRTLRESRRAMAGPPDETWMRQTINPLLEALELLHREAVYHRDIAPDNILLPHDGSQAVLLDFGAARRAIGDRTQTFTAILKPSYAPIEQYAESVTLRQGAWTDIYALGAAIHYLIKGVPPPPATARTIEDHSEVLAHLTVPGVSSTFLAAVDWALAVRPQDRPQSVAEFRDALDGKTTPPTVARQASTITLAIDPYVKTAADPVLHASADVPMATALPVDEPTMLQRSGQGSGVAPAGLPRAAQGPEIVAAAPVPANVAPSAPWSPPAQVLGDPTAPFKTNGGAERAAVGTAPTKHEVRPLAVMGSVAEPAKKPRALSPIATTEPAAGRSGMGAWPVAIPALLLVFAVVAWWWNGSGQDSDLTAANPTAAGQSQVPSVSAPTAVVPVVAPVPAVAATPTPTETPVAVNKETPSTEKPNPVAAAPVTVPTPTPTPVAAATKASPVTEKREAPATARVEPRTVENTTTTSNTNNSATPRIVLTRPTSTGNEAPRPVEAPAAANQRPAGSPLWPPVPAAEPVKPRTQTPTPAAAREEGPHSPSEACGSRVFLALVQCIERQCNSGKFASHPQCAEVRARREQPAQDVYGGGR
ncbi:MAG: protein kinase domain-containing protein [Burkholderiales bacterium]